MQCLGLDSWLELLDLCDSDHEQVRGCVSVLSQRPDPTNLSVVANVAQCGSDYCYAGRMGKHP